MALAQARSGKHLQVGTQSRSTAVVQDAIARVRDGAIGTVLVAKAWNSQRRRSIGKTQPSEPPPIWNSTSGPAPRRRSPTGRTCSPASGAGGTTSAAATSATTAFTISMSPAGGWASRLTPPVACLGGKSYFDDDQQFPDTQYAVFEYPDAAGSGQAKQLVFEQRIWSPYVQEGYENGAAFTEPKGC